MKMKKNLFTLLSLLCLFCTPVMAETDEKMAVCLDQVTPVVADNAPMAERLRSAVVSYLTSLGRVTVVDSKTLGTLPEAVNERVKTLGQKGFAYVLSGTLDNVAYATENNVAAMLSYTVRLTNARTGEVAYSRSFQKTAHAGNSEEAMQKVMEDVRKDITALANDVFPAIGTVKAIDKMDKNEVATEVYVNLGSDQGIAEGQQLDVYQRMYIGGEPVWNKVTELKVIRLVGGNMTLCKCTAGGRKIKPAMDAEQILRVVNHGAQTRFWNN